jgi:hypothetical protein
MTFRIPSGKHYARPWRFSLHWNRNAFAWKVKFTDSCRYEIQGNDQYDTNKLCGIGYLPHHHNESARFGWRYSLLHDQIELSAYCYVNGQRVIKPICFIDIGKEYNIELTKLSTMYFFTCSEVAKLLGSAEVPYDHNHKLGYGLYPFFGGQARAQHEIIIELKKI